MKTVKMKYAARNSKQHHLEVVIWNKGGKEEIDCNKELRSRPEEKKWAAKEVATSP